MSNLLYFCGMCTLLKELLLIRFFSKVSLHSHFIMIEHLIVLKRIWKLIHLVIGLIWKSVGNKIIWQEVRGSAEVPESDIVQACRRVSPSITLHFHISFISYSICVASISSVIYAVASRETESKRLAVSRGNEWVSNFDLESSLKDSLLLLGS